MYGMFHNFSLLFSLEVLTKPKRLMRVKNAPSRAKYRHMFYSGCCRAAVVFANGALPPRADGSQEVIYSVDSPSYVPVRASCLCCGRCRTVDAAPLSAVNETCQSCGPHCMACDGAASHCVSCAPHLILHNHQCVATCPAGTYQDGQRSESSEDGSARGQRGCLSVKRGLINYINISPTPEYTEGRRLPR